MYESSDEEKKPKAVKKSYKDEVNRAYKYFTDLQLDRKSESKNNYETNLIEKIEFYLRNPKLSQNIELCNKLLLLKQSSLPKYNEILK